MAKLESLPIIPLKETVVFPESVTPLYVMRPQSLLALEAAMEVDKRVFLTAQKDAEADPPTSKDVYRVGTVSEIIQILRLPDGTSKILVEGIWAGRVSRFSAKKDFLQGQIEPYEFDTDESIEMEAQRRGLAGLFENYCELSGKLPEDLSLSIKGLTNPLQLANMVANYTQLKADQKQEVLERVKVSEKLTLLTQFLATDNELLALENQILSEVRGKIGKSQKEYFLNEQLKVIERELGFNNEEDFELDELHEKIVKSKMPEQAREKAHRELNRLARMSPVSPEATVSRTYVEWLTDLPWGKYTKDQLDLVRAQQILDEDHFGLEKIKDRIIEHLAVHKLVPKMDGPILCLVGPPGVGKTSLARSVARALKRKFVRISLGGMRDEAEIRGHRRTYIGSLPGKMIQWVAKAETMNPVFLLDEIDKMSSDFRGDPASALLEVLDPEQNKTFNDHYLEVDFDLSRVMFITTANTTNGIPYPLLDRMELIRVPGYTESEKRSIAENYLIPKQIKKHGLKKRQLTFSSESINEIIRSYTHEAGVRNLEREIASVCRKTARQIVSDENVKVVKVTPEKVRNMLGPVRHQGMELHDVKEIGVATGLAWTEAGGEILPVETTLMPGKGQLILTGKLGDVMKESARAAISYIRTHAKKFGVDPDFHKKLDVHIHFPEGAIPKDGPSAGITVVISVLSALTNRPVLREVAMTGEITLRGKVLKIGGLKEKAVAAHRAKVEMVLIPKDNEPELVEIAQEVRDAIEFVPVSVAEEAIERAFEKPKKKKKSGASSGRKSTKRKRTNGSATRSTPPNA